MLLLLLLAVAQVFLRQWDVPVSWELGNLQDTVQKTISVNKPLKAMPNYKMKQAKLLPSHIENKQHLYRVVVILYNRKFWRDENFAKLCKIHYSQKSRKQFW